MKGRELRLFLVVRDGPNCFWCKRMTFDPSAIGFREDDAQTVDHLDTPKARRSVDDPSRAVIACHRCNRDRGPLTAEEWQAVLAIRLAPAKQPN